jgi:alanyl-tRNA synthetase
LVDKYIEEQNKKLASAENALKEKVEALKNKTATLYSRVSSDGNFAAFISKEIDANASLQTQEEALQKLIEKLTKEIASAIKNDLLKKVKDINGISFLAEKIEISNADSVKGISFELKNEVKNIFCLLGAEIDSKPHLSLIISENLVKEKNLDASKIIRELAKEIQGGGGGQPFYATAGGKNSEGLTRALEKGKSLIV